MASSHARLLVSTMDPMLDSRDNDSNLLLELDKQRADGKRHLERAKSLPMLLTPLPRGWAARALPPEPAAPAAAPAPAPAPAPAFAAAAATPKRSPGALWQNPRSLITGANNNDVARWWQVEAGRGKFGFKGLASRTANRENRKARDQAAEDAKMEAKVALRNEAPEWWKVPEPVLQAADSFDGRHVSRLLRAERMRAAALEEAENQRKAQALKREIHEVLRNRYVEPYKRVEVIVVKKKAVKKVVKKVEEKPFILENTIWAPRKSWCDAKAFYDTPEVKGKRFQIDWQSAIETLGLDKVILRSDADGQGAIDEDGDGLPEEVEEVGAVLLQSCDLIFNMFNYYSAIGEDIFGWTFNDWTMFVNEHRLARKSYKFCKKSDLDRLFIVIDAASSRYWQAMREKLKTDARPDGAMKARAEREDKRKALSRVEFTAALVYIAIYQYVQTGDIADVSEAVEKLLTKDLASRVDQRVNMDPNTFRRSTCYTREVTDVLEAHESSLRLLFAGVAGGGRTGNAASLMGLEEWTGFLNALEFIGIDCSERDARFAFVWSRMCVVDGRFHRGHQRESNLPFEGFLEALVRVSIMRGLPTDQEIAEAGHKHAGSYMAELKIEDEAKYEKMLQERATPWGELPVFQPPHRKLAHTISMIAYTIEADTAGSDNMQLTEKEITSWLRGKGLYGYEALGAI